MPISGGVGLYGKYMFSYVERNFIEEYVRNESEIEGVDYKTPNGKGDEILVTFYF